MSDIIEQDLDLDPNPNPDGELAQQTVALPNNINQHGQIHGGWLAGQMDMAGCIACTKVAKGKVATVSIEYISFLAPIQLGSVVGCYTSIKGVGRSSIRVEIEAWINNVSDESEWLKVAEGEFIFVAIDDNGRTRAIPR